MTGQKRVISEAGDRFAPGDTRRGWAVAAVYEPGGGNWPLPAPAVSVTAGGLAAIALSMQGRFTPGADLRLAAGMLPLPDGTVFDSRAAIAVALRASEGGLRAALSEISGAMEIRVALRAKGVAAPPGAAASQEQARVIAKLACTMNELAIRTGRTPEALISNRTGESRMAISLLVAEENRGALNAALALATRLAAGHGLSVEVSEPGPALSFPWRGWQERLLKAS